MEVIMFRLRTAVNLDDIKPLLLNHYFDINSLDKNGESFPILAAIENWQTSISEVLFLIFGDEK